MAQPFLYRIKESLALKLFIIGFLVLILLIPAGMISNMITKRSYRQEEVVREITEKWGGDQTVTGPVITIPYRTYEIVNETIRERGKPNTIRERKRYGALQYATFLPEEFQVNGDINTSLKSRGIFDAVIYKSGVTIDALFGSPDFSKLTSKKCEVQWDQVTLSLGISNIRGIRDELTFTINGKKMRPEPGTPSNSFTSGISQKFAVTAPEKPITFSTTLTLNGSGKLGFIPVGKKNSVTLTSPWHSPSFFGSALPDESEISEEGFNAQWNIMSFNRDFPQQWVGNRTISSSNCFGVEVIKPVDQYRAVSRSAKYALLFILLTFISLFIVEVLLGKRIHPIQYLLIGFALTLFYTLLLSISEHTGFTPAYLIASIASIALISTYIQGVLNELKVTLTLAGLLSILYSFLFITLHQEEYALLMGSVGLFLILGAIMFTTRKIDWYSLSSSDQIEEPDELSFGESEE